MSGRARATSTLASAAAAGVLLFGLAGRAQAPAPRPAGAPPPGAVGAEAAPGAPAAPASPSANVKITIITVPSQKGVFVFWGKKRLGAIAPHQPLILQRPRDSGPLDLVIKCQGFVTVQTRAYTFGDSKLAVKLTPLDQKNTLLGYREEVPPPPPPDAGVPAAPPAASALPPGVAAPPPAPRLGFDAGAR
jgi:hypothetical protein